MRIFFELSHHVRVYTLLILFNFCNHFRYDMLQREPSEGLAVNIREQNRIHNESSTHYKRTSARRSSFFFDGTTMVPGIRYPKNMTYVIRVKTAICSRLNLSFLVGDRCRSTRITDLPQQTMVDYSRRMAKGI